MKLSTKGRYGLRILLDLAIHGGTQPRMMREIASSQRISEKYISRLMIDLRHAELVQSVRGAKGGYVLGRVPQAVTLLEVVEAMEGRLNIVDCVTLPDACDKTDTCVVRHTWTTVNNRIRDVLAAVTLQDIADLHLENGDPASVVDYCI